MTNDNLESIQALAKEVAKMINRIIEQKNLVCIKTGLVKSKNGNKYVVSIENEDFTIESQLNFSVNSVVNVLTNYKLKGKKFLLG